MALTLPTSTTAIASNALAADARSLNALKYEAGQNSPQAAKEAAKQFESLFMRELIKSMREATMKSGLMDGAQGDLGEPTCWTSSCRSACQACPAACPKPLRASFRARWAVPTPASPCRPPSACPA